jgi:CelD/BcsL family acetyltransferase involved in cellulose biosynthesis
MGPSELTLAVVTDATGFAGLREEWDRLTGSAADTVFLTHAWLGNWLTFLGDDHEPYVLTARDGDRLVAALPLARTTRALGIRALEFMGAGTLTPNHLDVLAEAPYRDAAVGAFIARLLEDREWDVLDLDKLPEDSATTRALAAAFAGAGMPSELRESAVCPYAELPSSYDEFFATLSKSARRHTRERIRCIGREHPDARFGVVETEQELDAALEALVRLHQARWEERGYAGSFADPRVGHFHKAMTRDALRDGYLRFYTLTEGADVKACVLCYRMNGSVQAYSCAFEPSWGGYRPGMVLGAHAIEQSIAEGAHRYDHLEGDEQHKSTWAGHERKNLRFTAFAPSLRGRLAHGTTIARERAVETARTVLPPERREALVKLRSRLQAQRG